MQEGIQRTDRNLPPTWEHDGEDARGVERLREDIGDELLALERGDDGGQGIEGHGDQCKCSSRG